MIQVMVLALLTIGQIGSAARACSTTDSLTVRNAHAMAYDDVEGVVMLFGGADERAVRGDLWAWDGQAWSCVSAAGPSPRTFPAMAYDGQHGNLLLFGGNRVLFGTDEDTATFLGDTWVWERGSWREVRTFPTPPPRAEAAVAYDQHRGRVVLFGGHRVVDGERVRLGDTWEWDGEGWERRSGRGPAPRNGSAMAYDSIRRRVVLFGGSGASGDTWEWDGREWRNVPSADAAPRFNSAMAYHEGLGGVVRFAGWVMGERLGDTWRYDGTRWVPLAGLGPEGRNHTAMAYDGHRGVAVLFGGHDGESVFGDTWELHRNGWVRVANHGSRARIPNGH